jgi:hypothetical protein
MADEYLKSFPGLGLEEVPAVLLSECYNDLPAIAATGTGYGSEWEKKIESSTGRN